MKAVFARSVMLGMAAALAGCASTGGPVQVTRLHLGEPVARGQISIEPFDVPGGAGPEFRTYAAAVEQELTKLGWTVVNTVGQSEQVALLGIEWSPYRGSQPGPVSVGVGGGTGGGGSGLGMGLGFNLGGSTRNLAATTLQVRIKRRSDGSVFWEGRATGTARSDKPEGSPPVLAPRLAEAVFRGFPGESGRTISVK